MVRPFLLLAAAVVAAPAAAPFVTRFSPAELGGIGSVMRWTVARPSRDETRVVFLTVPERGALPQEVQIVAPDGGLVSLADVEGADCTLAHVEIVTGRAAEVIVATRPFVADQAQSDPAVMQVQRYRPVAGDDAGDSDVMLRASGPPVRTAPLCHLADIRRAMLQKR